MYSFGAMLSFTIAHASVIALRRKQQRRRGARSARGPTCGSGASTWPLFAVFGGLGTAIAWLVVVVQYAPARWAGLGWLAVGLALLLASTAAASSSAPLTRDRARAGARARPVARRSSTGPSSSRSSARARVEEALVAAARLAAERGATVAVAAA